MSKYIDAERLKRSVESIGLFPQKQADYNDGREDMKMMVLDLIDSLQQEQPEVDYNKFEKLFDDFCERNKGHHITAHDACMWFWELGLNARNGE